MPEAQNFKNHARVDPPFHYIIGPAAIANLILSAYITVRDWPLHSRSHLWWIFMSAVLVLIVARLRTYSLKVQDRVIRLEERLRYTLLLPAGALEQANSLTIQQIVALRFASDAELPALLDRAVKENLTPKQIKQSIVSWRPDHTRV